MLVKCSTRFFDRFVGVTTSRRGSHDLFDANFGSTAVIGRDATTHVPLGDDAYQFEVFSILDHRRATVS